MNVLTKVFAWKLNFGLWQESRKLVFFPFLFQSIRPLACRFIHPADSIQAARDSPKTRHNWSPQYTFISFIVPWDSHSLFGGLALKMYHQKLENCFTLVTKGRFASPMGGWWLLPKVHGSMTEWLHPQILSGALVHLVLLGEETEAILKNTQDS